MKSIKLGAWNGGRIISLTIAEGKGELQEPVDDAIHTFTYEEWSEKQGTDDTAIAWSFKPGDYGEYEEGDAITITVKMESDGSYYNGSLGVGDADDNWVSSEQLESTDSAWTLEVPKASAENEAQVQVWWMNDDATYVKVTDIQVKKAESEPQEPEDDVAHTGSVTGTALAATDWDGIEISLSDLIGDVRPSTITAIEFTSDKPFVVGYNGSEGWQQQADGTSYSISDIVLSDNYFLKVVLTAGDDLEHTISWKVHAQDNGEPLIATLNWHGTNVKETFRLEDYLAGLTVGDQVGIEVKFESTAASWGGSLGCNDSGGWKDVEFNNSSPTAKLSFTVMYDNPTPQIQLYWADENAVVNAYLVSATKSEPVTGIAKANMLAAGGMNERNTIPSSVSGNVSDGAATVSGGDAADVENGEDGVTTVSGNDAE